MGNTNSMNNMSLLDQKRYQAEFLRYSQIPYDSQYLQQQQPQSIHASNMNLHQINKYKDQHPLSNPVKVLPDVKFEPKLRTTNNGAILSSGGTISGRKDSECGLHRSKSISETQNTYLSNPNGMPAPPPPQFRMQRASTQLSINLQNQSRSSNLNKNFGSSHDLKNNLDAKNNINDRRPMDNKNHRDMRKSRAPPPPTNVNSNNNINSSSNNNNSNNRIKMTPPPTMQAPEPPTSKVKSKAPMAQRMFGDTLKNGKNMQLAKVKQKIESDIAIKPKEVTKTSVTKVIPAPTQSKPAQIIPKVNPVSYLRRERTFDMTLMQTENKEKFRPKFSPQFQRKMNMSEHQNHHQQQRQQPIVEQRQMTTQERYRASVGSRVNNNTNAGFQSELQSATKLKRSTAITASDNKSKVLEKKPLKKMSSMPIPTEPSPPPPLQNMNIKVMQKQPVEKKKSDNSAISNPTMSANSSFKFSKPVLNKEPEIIQFHRHGEEIELPVTREQISSPKDDVHGNMNNFYFGMNEASVDTDEEDDNDDNQNDVEAAQMDAINKFAENIFKMSSVGSSNMPQSQAESIISDREFDSDSSDILLQLRPTLPRRQLQIPRFSPVAAWKSLANETNMLDSRNNKISSSLLQLQDESSKHETKIERIYREPSFNLHHLDNKSGDSGISADKEIGGNNSPDGQMPTAYLMSSWTPQQDLEEDEESVDGDEKESFHHHDNDKSQSFVNATNGHMFSLSLPRDNFSVSDKGQPQNNFYTLQKFRKSAAEVFSTNVNNNDGKINIQNYPGDSNWLLSSQPNSIDDYSPRKEGERNQIISQMTKGKHVMYLPTNFDDNHRYESTININNNNNNYNDDNDESPRYKFSEGKPTKSKSKSKFKFQSTIRQVERRKIAEKLSREAEEKEMHRLGELEAMQKVEEEFQKKRAREKNLIKQQLRIASMEDEDFEPQNYFNFNHLSKNHFNDNIDDEIDTRTPYISRIIEAKSPRVTVSQYKSS